MKKKIGFALTGSFCTLDKALSIMEEISPFYHLIPILSERVAETDTRFFQKKDLIEKVETICGSHVICSVCDAEPLGPKGLLDLMVVCPCTGNTLSKLAHGITDSSVTMAVKSHRRGGKNTLLALSTNDALSGSAASFGTVLEKKGFFFVPLKQDAPDEKPSSLQCDFSLVPKSIEEALAGRQMRPLFL